MGELWLKHDALLFKTRGLLSARLSNFKDKPLERSLGIKYFDNFNKKTCIPIRLKLYLQPL